MSEPPRPPPSLLRRLIRSVVVHRPWWLVLWAIYALVVGLSLRASLQIIGQHNLEVATEGARNVFRTIVLARQWNAQHKGVYVPVTPQTQPNPYLEDPRRDIQSSDGRWLTLVNPAYMTRMMSQLSVRNTELSFRGTSLQPINPDNAPDEWERDALHRFESGTPEVSGLSIQGDGQTVFRYIAPLKVTQECLDCHAKQAYRVGDIRGGISISQSYAPLLEAARPSERNSMLAHGLVLLLFVGISWWSMEHLRSSWTALEGSIEELKQTRDELVRNEKMASLGRMVAGFAHELNTPVGIAVGSISHNEETLRQISTLLDQEDVSEHELRAHLATLQQGGELALTNLKRAATLVQRFKRSSIDQSSEQPRAFGLRELIDDVVFALQGQLAKSGVEVQVDCPEALRLNSVPGLIDQLLTNLLHNSLQHGFADGTRPGHIHIAVDTTTPGRLHLVYRDDGVGMSDEAARHLFEPFFTTRRGQGGSGLGMFICYNIVTTQLRGAITLLKPADNGVCFDITFPCALADPPGSAA